MAHCPQGTPLWKHGHIFTLTAARDMGHPLQSPPAALKPQNVLSHPHQTLDLVLTKAGTRLMRSRLCLCVPAHRVGSHTLNQAKPQALLSCPPEAGSGLVSLS